MKENIRIRKIHLDTLLKVLVEMFDKGVDYVDIIGEINDVQDTIGISFCKEYMSDDMRENFDEIDSDVPKEHRDKETMTFSKDEDLNQLI